jgi:biotin transporter BioY
VGVDTIRMASGYLVMFVYAMFMLGKINKVEHRTYLALAGILACFFGLIISMGLTMAIGYYYTTIHGILPFMALGKCTSSMIPFSKQRRRNLQIYKYVFNILLRVGHESAT